MLKELRKIAKENGITVVYRKGKDENTGSLFLYNKKKQPNYIVGWGVNNLTKYTNLNTCCISAISYINEFYRQYVYTN